MTTPAVVMTPAAARAEHLSHRYGRTVALDDVSLAIPARCMVGLIGPDGVGKSTLLALIAGVRRIQEGEVSALDGDMRDAEHRRSSLPRIAYMPQGLGRNLYPTLTVFENLDFFGRLFGQARAEREQRITELLAVTGLDPFPDRPAGKLSGGMKQKLSLCCSLIHDPDLLLLDEPTSGVDPVARDSFWRYLISLSRDDGVTIFVSTHFMNEAERCDRISLMNAGKVLAVGTAKELTQRRGMTKLEDAFIAYLEDAAGIEPGAKPSQAEASPEPIRPAVSPASVSSRFDFRRLWAYARRETMEILRDPIRLGFALAGPLILLLTIGYGISFDVEHLAFAAFDQDQTTQSRELLENFSGSRYFTEHPAIASDAELDRRHEDGELALAIEIPPNFGKHLLSDQQPEVSVSLDVAMPFRAETASGYVTGVALSYSSDQAARGHISGVQQLPVNVDERFRYNQAFKSVYASVPSSIMLLLILIPAMMTAVGSRPRKGDRIDRQFPVHADHRNRIPARQAAAVCRHRTCQFPDAIIDSDLRLRRTGEGIGCRALFGDIDLHRRGHHIWPAHLLFHDDPGGRHFYDDGSDPHRRDQFLGPPDALFLAFGGRPLDRHRLPSGMVHPNQPGDIYEGPRIFGALARHTGAARLRPWFSCGGNRGAAQAGGVRWLFGWTMCSGSASRSCTA